MSENIVTQFIYETESWRRLLYFYREENVYNRKRLSEILSNTVSEELLERAEYFQDHFVMSDETIHWLMDEIHQHIKFLSQNITSGIQTPGLAIRNQQVLKNDILKAEEVLLKLKTEFNNFLAESVIDKS